MFILKNDIFYIFIIFNSLLKKLPSFVFIKIIGKICDIDEEGSLKLWHKSGNASRVFFWLCLKSARNVERIFTQNLKGVNSRNRNTDAFEAPQKRISFVQLSTKFHLNRFPNLPWDFFRGKTVEVEYLRRWNFKFDYLTTFLWNWTERKWQSEMKCLVFQFEEELTWNESILTMKSLPENSKTQKSLEFMFNNENIKY